MSFSNINIGEKVRDYKTSEVFNAYGRVDIVLGEDEEGNVIVVSYPNKPDSEITGRILTIDMPMCTNTTLARNAATRIFNSLLNKNPTAFQYQPHQTQEALVDPSIEFGDSIDVNNVHSGFYTRKVVFGRLMPHDLTSPADEEIDHEYHFESSEQRQITRSNKEYKAGLYVNAQAITAEISRASAAEGQLSTRITATAEGLAVEISDRKSADNALSTIITATANGLSAEITNRQSADSALSTRITANAGAISARVTKTGGDRASFAWTLDTTGHHWYSGNKEVMKVTSSGLEVTGKITATSGEIGGFKIGANELSYNNQTWGGTQTTGIYIGRNGIQCGNANGNYFRVTNQGELLCNNITATSMKLKGTLSFYNSDGTLAGTLDAAKLQKGASEAYSKYGGWDSTKSSVDTNSGTWSGGAAAGYSAQTDWSNARSSDVGCGTLYGEFRGTIVASNGLHIAYGYGTKQVGVTSVRIGGSSYQILYIP